MSLHAQEPACPIPNRNNLRCEAAPEKQGPARQLAHESREAAGEEKDEMAEFKQSASVKMISKWTGLGLQQSYWLSVVLNFAVIAVVIVWAGQKYLPGMFRDRTAAIQKAMQEAQKASEEARRKLAEIETRLHEAGRRNRHDARTPPEKEGAAEEAESRLRPRKMRARSSLPPEQEIAAAAKSARRQLTAYAADLAVALAAETDSRRCRHRSGLGAEFRRPVGRGIGNSGKDGN